MSVQEVRNRARATKRFGVEYLEAERATPTSELTCPTCGKIVHPASRLLGVCRACQNRLDEKAQDYVVREEVEHDEPCVADEEVEPGQPYVSVLRLAAQRAGAGAIGANADTCAAEESCVGCAIGAPRSSWRHSCGGVSGSDSRGPHDAAATPTVRARAPSMSTPIGTISGRATSSATTNDFHSHRERKMSRGDGFTLGMAVLGMCAGLAMILGIPSIVVGSITLFVIIIGWFIKSL